jgi:hydroxymethylglutaryl-CoA lyase
LQVFLSLKIYGANKIIECPRDAMQGIKPFIPTERKVAYIQSLLVGFDSDFGSFVSPKAIPQMQDTAAVLGN